MLNDPLSLTSILDTNLEEFNKRFGCVSYLKAQALWLKFLDNIEETVAGSCDCDGCKDSLFQAFLILYPMYDYVYKVEEITY